MISEVVFFARLKGCGYQNPLKGLGLVITGFSLRKG